MATVTLADFTPHAGQKNILANKHQRMVACMGRRWGKTASMTEVIVNYPGGALVKTQPNWLEFPIAVSLRSNSRQTAQRSGFLTEAACDSEADRLKATKLQSYKVLLQGVFVCGASPVLAQKNPLRFK